MPGKRFPAGCKSYLRSYKRKDQSFLIAEEIKGIKTCASIVGTVVVGRYVQLC